MLYSIAHGYVEGYSGGQSSMVHLCTTLDVVQESGRPFAFTDGHGIMSFTSFFDDPSDMAKLPWDIIESNYWSDNAEHPDRKRRKQAEFLVHDYLRWDAITHVGVQTPEMKALVTDAISNIAHKPKVCRKPSWYY
jgi:hypothetical protein